MNKIKDIYNRIFRRSRKEELREVEEAHIEHLIFERGREYHFNNSTEIDEGISAAYRWDFGDGTTSDEQNVTHAYQAVGDYEICFTVSVDGCGASTTRKKVTVVEPKDKEHEK